MGFQLHGLGAHVIGFSFQGMVVVDTHAIDFCIGGDAALALLGYVPCLVGKVLLLAGAEVDVVALGIGEGADLGRLAAVAVDVYALHAGAGQLLNATAKGGWKATALLFLLELGGVLVGSVLGSFELGDLETAVCGCLNRLQLLDVGAVVG